MIGRTSRGHTGITPPARLAVNHRRLTAAAGGLSSNGEGREIISLDRPSGLQPTPRCPRMTDLTRNSPDFKTQAEHRAALRRAGFGERQIRAMLYKDIPDRVAGLNERLCVDSVPRHFNTHYWAAENRRNPTPSEARLWSAIRDRKLGVAFVRQYPIGLFIVDFCCPLTGLIVEVDGGYHNTSDGADRDAWRERKIMALGKYRFLRFTNSQVDNRLDRVIDVIQNNLSPHRSSAPDRRA